MTSRCAAILLVLLAPATSAAQAPPDSPAETLPPNAVVRLGTHRFRVPLESLLLQTTPDGTLILQAGVDGAVHVLDATSGLEQRLLRTNIPSPRATALTPDALVIAACGEETCEIYTHGSLQKPLVASAPGHRFTALAWSPDGKQLASGGAGGEIVLWTTEGVKVRQIEGKGRVTALAYVAAEEVVVVRSDGSAQRVELAEGKRRRETAVVEGLVASLIAPGARHVLRVLEGEVRIWKTESGEERVVKGDFKGTSAWSLSGDGSRMACWGPGARLVVRETGEGKELSLPDTWGRVVTATAFFPDGRRLVTGSGEKSLQVWETETGKDLSGHPGHHGRVTRLVVAPDGGRVMTVGSDGELRLWEAASGRALAQAVGAPAGFTSLAMSPDGTHVLAGDGEGELTFQGADLQGKPVRVKAHDGKVTAVAMLPGGKRAVSVGGDRKLRIWDVEKRVELQSVDLRQTSPLSLDVSGNSAAVGGSDGKILLFDLARPGTFTEVLAVGIPVLSVLLAPDQKTLFAGDANRVVHVLALDPQAPARRILGFDGPVTGLALSPDGARLAASSWGNSVRICTLEGKELARLHGSGGRILGVAWFPDGNRVAAPFENSTSLIWQIPGTK